MGPFLYVIETEFYRFTGNGLGSYVPGLIAVGGYCGYRSVGAPVHACVVTPPPFSIVNHQ